MPYYALHDLLKSHEFGIIVAFNVDNKVWVANMHILANMKSENQLKVCHYLGGDKGEGVKANGEKVWQGERGSKIGGRPVTYFLNGP